MAICIYANCLLHMLLTRASELVQLATGERACVARASEIVDLDRSQPFGAHVTVLASELSRAR